MSKDDIKQLRENDQILYQTMSRLEQKVDDGFEGVEKHLIDMEGRLTDEIRRSNTTWEPDDSPC